MEKEEIVKAIESYLDPSFERLIVAECVYKSLEFRSFSISVSDGKEDDVEIPYSVLDESEKDDLIELLKKRRTDGMKEEVKRALLAIKDELLKFDVEISDDDINSFVELEKPVLLLSRRK